MARNLAIKYIRATKAALDTNAGTSNLLEGEGYLVTDQARLAVGLSDSTYALVAMVSDLLWQKVGTVISPLTAGDKVEVSSTSATGSRAIKGTAAGTGSGGIEGIATGTASSGVVGTGAGFGGRFISTDGFGLAAQNASTTEFIEAMSKTTASTDAALPFRKSVVASSGTPADGLGIYEDWQIHTTTTQNISACQVVTKWTTATHATATSQREWWLKSAGGALARKMALAGAGQLTLDGYGSGTFTGTAAKWAAWTSAGAMIEMNAPIDSKWTLTSGLLTPSTAQAAVKVVTDSSTLAAMEVESTYLVGTALKAKGFIAGYFEGTGYAINAKGTGTGNGALFEATAGAGWIAQNTSATVPTTYSKKVTAITDAVVPVVAVQIESSGTVAAGFGMSETYDLELTSGSVATIFKKEYLLTAATGSPSGRYKFFNTRAGTQEVQHEILHTGQHVFNNYGASGATEAGTFDSTDFKQILGSKDGALVDIQPAKVQDYYNGVEITGAAAYFFRDLRYNRTTDVNRSTDVQIVLKKNVYRKGEWFMLHQVAAGRINLLGEVLEMASASAPTGVNGRYYISGVEAGKPLYYNAIGGYRIWWDTDRWKVATTVGGTVQFVRVDASPFGAYTADNGTGSPTATDVSAQTTIKGNVWSDGIGSHLKCICTDATTDANVFRVEYTGREQGAVVAETVSFNVTDKHFNSQATVSSATPVNVTFNLPTPPIGTKVDIMQGLAGVVTAVAGASVNVYGLGGGLKTYGQYSVMTAKVIAADTWLIIGGSA